MEISAPAGILTIFILEIVTALALMVRPLAPVHEPAKDASMRGQTQPLLRSWPSIQVPSPLMVGSAVCSSTAGRPAAKRIFVNGWVLAYVIAQRKVLLPSTHAPLPSPPSSTTPGLKTAGAACARPVPEAETASTATASVAVHRRISCLRVMQCPPILRAFLKC